MLRHNITCDIHYKKVRTFDLFGIRRKYLEYLCNVKLNVVYIYIITNYRKKINWTYRIINNVM